MSDLFSGDPSRRALTGAPQDEGSDPHPEEGAGARECAQNMIRPPSRSEPVSKDRFPVPDSRFPNLGIRIGAAHLFPGDAYKLLPAILQGLDPLTTACVTDPPYEFKTSGGGRMRKERDYIDKIEDAQLADGFDDRILSPSMFAAVAVFCHDNQAPDLWVHLRARYRRAVMLCWRKTNPMPMCNRNYVPETELYLHAWRDVAPPQGDVAALKRIWDGPVGKSEFDHPTVKPLALMKKIVANVGLPVVVDPFMGTGTTGVAALQARREGGLPKNARFIGIEKNPKFFEIAVRRIEAASFETAASPPPQDEGSAA